jgi:hypothetical protein
MSIVIEWTQEKKDKVAEKIEQWIRERGSAACFGEGIMQNDDCQIEAAPLIADLVDDIIEPKFIDDDE